MQCFYGCMVVKLFVCSFWHWNTLTNTTHLAGGQHHLWFCALEQFINYVTFAMAAQIRVHWQELFTFGIQCLLGGVEEVWVCCGNNSGRGLGLVPVLQHTFYSWEGEGEDWRGTLWWVMKVSDDPIVVLKTEDCRQFDSGHCSPQCVSTHAIPSRWNLVPPV